MGIAAEHDAELAKAIAEHKRLEEVAEDRRQLYELAKRSWEHSVREVHLAHVRIAQLSRHIA